jgi:tRNA G26 N,N-dimethylase Trm1
MTLTGRMNRVRPGTTHGTMSYQHCPRCRLAIRTRATYLTLVNCPRCLAHAGIVSPLFTSPLNASELRASDPEARPIPRAWSPAPPADELLGA